MRTDKISLLYPSSKEIIFNEVSQTTIHDLGMDAIISKLSQKENEVNFIGQVMCRMTADSEVAKYRIEIFDDILHNKKMRDELVELLDKISFLKDYGSFSRRSIDGPAVWELMHRLEEISDYITSVEGIHACLEKSDIKSTGLLNLKEYVKKLHDDSYFTELKADIANCKASTKNLKSITVGINLNEQFEAQEIGVVSINNKWFTKSNILSSFVDKISSGDNIQDGNDWNESMKFEPFSVSSDVIGSFESAARLSTVMAHPLVMSSIARVPDNDSTSGITYYMNSVTNKMLSLTTKKLRQLLEKYVTLSISDITNLIPEFIYYIKWAEYIEQLMEKGYSFSKPQVKEKTPCHRMYSTGIYNFKLAAFESEEHKDIVKNDLDFDDENLVYILTGANRGGKTTITQAVGQLFFMAQGGIYIPGDSFEFDPVDNIFTHFPADEDKTMDLGRLGEECKRFKEMFNDATTESLMLLNETFSTTSFEEGYYIAKDSVKALLTKGIRTIYNTHMHKLAFDVDELSHISDKYFAKSLIVVADGANRSYKVEVAAPVGKSYALDIAKKYGVTYEMLIE